MIGFVFRSATGNFPPGDEQARVAAKSAAELRVMSEPSVTVPGDCERPSSGLPGPRAAASNFGSCFQSNLSFLHFHGVLYGLASILLSDLLGFFLHKGCKAVHVPGHRFARSLFGIGKC
jgi:hypothetical protein